MLSRQVLDQVQYKDTLVDFVLGWGTLVGLLCNMELKRQCTMHLGPHQKRPSWLAEEFGQGPLPPDRKGSIECRRLPGHIMRGIDAAYRMTESPALGAGGIWATPFL